MPATGLVFGVVGTAMIGTRMRRGAAYNFAEHLPERRRMMQAWADFLDSLRGGADVVPLFRAASGAQ